MWPTHDVHEALVGGLREAAAAVELEQAVRGLDSLGELALHEILAAALIGAGFEAHREVRYPSHRTSARRSHGRRCDLVVTPAGVRLDEDAVQLSLPAGAPHTRTEVAPWSPVWMEVKRVAQFGEERARADYGAALQGPIWRDLEKLASDPAIEHAAQLVVLFTATAEVAEHDLAISLDRAWSRGLRLAPPLSSAFAIGERFGNGCCTVSLVRVVP